MGLAEQLPPELLVRVAIAPYAGEAGRGSTYGPVATVVAVLDDSRRVIRGLDKASAVAQATVLVDLGVACPPQSRVTVPDGRTLTAQTVERVAAAGGLPTDHQAITLT